MKLVFSGYEKARPVVMEILRTAMEHAQAHDMTFQFNPTGNGECALELVPLKDMPLFPGPDMTTPPSVAIAIRGGLGT